MITAQNTVATVITLFLAALLALMRFNTSSDRRVKKQYCSLAHIFPATSPWGWVFFFFYFFSFFPGFVDVELPCGCFNHNLILVAIYHDKLAETRYYFQLWRRVKTATGEGRDVREGCGGGRVWYRGRGEIVQISGC